MFSCLLKSRLTITGEKYASVTRYAGTEWGYSGFHREAASWLCCCCVKVGGESGIAGI